MHTKYFNFFVLSLEIYVSGSAQPYQVRILIEELRNRNIEHNNSHNHLT